MAVKRRTVVQGEKSHNLRHPMLKIGSTHLMLYNYIRAHPGCSTRMLRQIYPSGQPITELLDEGLIRAEGPRGKTTYTAVPENETGPRRDAVAVEVTLYVNDYGEYSASAKVIGQHLTAHEDNPREWERKQILLRPMRKEDPRVRAIVDLNEPSHLPQPEEANPLAGQGPLTIEGDYTILPDNK